MISSLKPYPAYKNSDVPWLGQVPEHWRILPALAVYREKQIKNVGLREKTVLSLSYGRIVIKPEEKLHGLVPESFETYQIVDPGDIVIRTTDLQNDRTSLRVGFSSHRGIITSAYLCLETKGCLSGEFGFQFLNTYDLLKIIYGFGSGLRQNLDFGDIKRMPVLVPPTSDQLAIVRFLNHAERQIAHYIRAKQKLTKLLDEQKQAIIHRAVTRGLDPNAPLKPSGLPSFGSIPQSWEIVPFKRRVAFQEGPGIMAVDFRDRGIPLLRISCLDGEAASLKSCNYLDPEMVDKRWGHFRVQAGDYLLSASASTGKICLATNVVEGAIPYTGIIRLWPKTPQVSMQYIKHLIGSRPFQDQLDIAKSGVAIEHFGPTHLKQIAVALPPYAEQNAIVEFVTDATSGFDKARASIAEEIALIRQFRTRLITDVVTGKLDARAVAMASPEATNEPEIIDEEGPLEGDDVSDDAGFGAEEAAA